MEGEPKFSTWAIVEVMGHGRYAGHVTEEEVAGCGFIRVEVPEIPAQDRMEGRPAFTKLLGTGSIFAMTPCTEQTAREAAKSFRARPLAMFELPMLPSQRTLGFEDDEDPDTY